MGSLIMLPKDLGAFCVNGSKGTKNKHRHTPTIPIHTVSHRELFVGNLLAVSLQAKFKVEDNKPEGKRALRSCNSGLRLLKDFKHVPLAP